MSSGLPPFSALLKSRDVEDPVNLWLHRPLAYALVAALHRTAVTPNQVTVTAMLFGLAAAACWLVGSPVTLVVGGGLLWASAILDGADGILARAKSLQSDIGRALDGTADSVVATATVIAGFWHLARVYEYPWLPVLMIVAVLTATIQIALYDYYKEVYLHVTQPGRGPRVETENAELVAAKLEQARARGAPLAVRLSLSTLAGLLTLQRRLLRLTNPASLIIDRRPTTAESARRYRRLNYGPMQVWALLSLCPHTYLMSLAAILGRLDLYFWFRVLVANALFVVVLIWQRIATERAAVAAGPGPATEAGP